MKLPKMSGRSLIPRFELPDDVETCLDSPTSAAPSNLELIDPKYIATIRATIEKVFPDCTWGPSPYPDEHLKWRGTPRTRLFPRDEPELDRYNPLHLRIPYNLVTLDRFLDDPKIDYLRQEASQQRLNFLREYHLLYVDILDAINGNNVAKARIREKIETDGMYWKAGINTEYLNVDNSSTFRRSLLPYLVLGIVRSPEKAISTATRVRALELLYAYDIDKIAAAFAEHRFGFTAQDDEPVKDLIPRSFMTTVLERGGLPHNNLFAKNSKIQTIFQVKKHQLNEIDFKQGFSLLLQLHPAETVQTLLSLLRCHKWSRDVMLGNVIFHELVNLSRLDPGQREILFGVKASYRVDSQHADSSGGGVWDSVDSLPS